MRLLTYWLRLLQGSAHTGPVQIPLAGASLEALEGASFGDACTGLTASLSVDNTTVYLSEHLSAGEILSLPDDDPACAWSAQPIPVDLCRVVARVDTSPSSSLALEVWLPRRWTGRQLTIGNGGLSGCIQYWDVAYAASLGFAAVSTNNGHNGTSGRAFYRQTEVLRDFAYRSVTTAASVGRLVSQAFYGKDVDRSYYFGCSTGGRQGLKAAQDFPDHFDGIVAGAPAIAFNSLLSWSGMFYQYLGGNATAEPLIPQAMWPTIHADVMRQCDGLDGVLDGVIEDTTLCRYRAEELLCRDGEQRHCLTGRQAAIVDKIFTPLFDRSGNLAYSRMVPGSEEEASALFYRGRPFQYTSDWFRYAIYNDPRWSISSMNLADLDNALRVDPHGIQTWRGDLSDFRARGGKLITYHGGQDGWISPENSERYYDHVSRSMELPSSSLDGFYRHFRIAGMGHCNMGHGAWEIGQSQGFTSSKARANVLMAMVEWVEQGRAPDTLLGTKHIEDDPGRGIAFSRAHCRYPRRNVYDGAGNPRMAESWHCS